ncbi:hypothetical protein BJ742DRAFT_864003 [Cladochytrium replicatum]|nr:hypothetical protein BJ742DRAFT_864003 [Cladochytrium replicatum]
MLDTAKNKRRVARPELTAEHKGDIKEAFDLFDTDKDHQVAMRTIILEYDKGGQALIEFDDFNNVMSERLLDREPMEEIRKAFKLFDGRRNLRKVAKEMGENIDDDELQAMIDEFNLDQDGEIDEQEFIAIMTETDP